MCFKKAVYCLLLWAAFPLLASAQSADTLRLTLPETETIFLRNNLQLLAGHYQVAADSALIIQARLWDNPLLNTDQNVYANHRFFEHGTDGNGNETGQVYVQIQQLIRTAGKRGKQIELASSNARLSMLQLEDLLRNLRLQLHGDFYRILQLESISRLYIQQKSQLGTLLRGMQSQLEAGNIARKDFLRIQALDITLDQDILENENELNEAEAAFRTLLPLRPGTFFQPIADTFERIPDLLPLNTLLDRAHADNPAFRLRQEQLVYEQTNLRLQKALAVPDVTLGPNYDRNSNYAPNYFGLGVSLPLPILNRNQGNIRSAEHLISRDQAQLSSASYELDNNVSKAYTQLRLAIDINTPSRRKFFYDYDQLYNNIVESYRQRQISLIEFTDYFDAYKDAREQLLKQQLNLQLAKEELNYQVGSQVTN